MGRIDTGTPAFRDTAARQEAVSAPGTSAWVSANAGSGKTHVLTGRVIRLLMGEPGIPAVAPDRILCITFTKAAAAEMQNRLFRTLGEWALSSDADLRMILDDRFGKGERDLVRVRSLFARALETPGGLKIKTIHSFCESLLSRFPVEADLLPGFAVADEAQMAALSTTAWTSLIEKTAADNTIGRESLARLLARMKCTDEIRNTAGEIVRHAPEGAEFLLAGRLGLSISGSAAGGPDPRQTALDALDGAFLRRLALAAPDIRAEPKCVNRSRWAKVATLADRILSDDSPALDALFDEACAAFLEKGVPASPRIGLPFVRDRIPEAKERFAAAADTIAEAHATIATAEALTLTKDLISVGRVLDTHRRTALGAAALVDFDGLIERANALLERTDPQWIDRKLDHGLTHILLDEAQDTGTDQWPILRRVRQRLLTRGRDGEPLRTLFVVGDKKQSIYSFQGADAELFDRERTATAAEADRAGVALRNEEFTLSFRSSPVILEAVDALFDGEAAIGVSVEPIVHSAARPALPGRVELWPLARRTTTDDNDLWHLPVDAAGPAHPHRQLAETIAHDIVRFVEGAGVADRNGDVRPARYGDIMILCRTRRAFYRELIRTLSVVGVPNAGADRLALTDDIAVKDMMAALRVAANRDDDLSLAEVLKSPLGGWDEEALLRLAADRGRQTLWAQLEAEAHGGDPKAVASLNRLNEAIRIGRNAGPFAFLETLLEEGIPTGRHLIRSRIGGASDEALGELLAEALRFENEAAGTLNGFLYHLEQLSVHIKRDPGEGGDVVRIMTVHGAKGLEAPCVYLADAAAPPRGPAQTLVPVLNDKGEDDGVRLVGGKALAVVHDRVAEGHAQQQAAAMAEYRRQFYVGATRAEQRLVICGTESGGGRKGTAPEAVLAEKSPADCTWYGLAMQAFERMRRDRTIEEKPCEWSDRPILVLGDVLPPASGVRPDHRGNEGENESTAPSWLTQAAARETPRSVLTPSAALPPDAPAPEGPVLPPRRGSEGISPRERGILIHKLLEVLPGIPPEQREETGRRMLARRAATVSAAVRANLLTESLSVLAEAAFAAVFAPSARAEVSVRGTVHGAPVNGQIDRLLVTPERVLCVDYKTMRPPPVTAEDTPPGIALQLALYAALLEDAYPGRSVETAVLYTYAPRLVPLPRAMLTAALETLG